MNRRKEEELAHAKTVKKRNEQNYGCTCLCFPSLKEDEVRWMANGPYRIFFFFFHEDIQPVPLTCCCWWRRWRRSGAGCVCVYVCVCVCVRVLRLNGGSPITSKDKRCVSSAEQPKKAEYNGLCRQRIIAPVHTNWPIVVVLIRCADHWRWLSPL